MQQQPEIPAVPGEEVATPGCRRREGDLDQSAAPDFAAIIRSLLTDHASPARVLELYYWSQEPGAAAVIRAFVALPEEARAALHSFLVMAQDPKKITTTVDELERLTLSSPQVADALMELSVAMRARRAPVRSQRSAGI